MTIHSLYLVGSFFLVILSIVSTKIGKGGPWGSCRSTQGRDRVSGKIPPIPPKNRVGGGYHVGQLKKEKDSLGKYPFPLEKFIQANKFKWYIVISIIGLV